MLIDVRITSFFIIALLWATSLSAQQYPSPTQTSSNRIDLDVVVMPKSGPPVSDLQRQDFTILDNKVPQTITSFRAIDGRQATIEVVVVIDAVNSSFQNVAYQRGEIDKFFHSEGGNLSHPTALAMFTDSGILMGGFTTDGNVLSASLGRSTTALRTIRRSGGFYSADAQHQLSLQALHELVNQEGSHRGRKLILWISPGWPLLSALNIQVDPKEQQGVFSDIVSFSTELRQGRITLYSIDPLGAAEPGQRTTYWKNFLKGITKPGQVQPGNLALQVLATQSGGLALNSSNDIAAEIQKSVADTASYYEISFSAPPAKSRDEYHQLEVKLSKSGLTARTRQGYYDQP